MYFLWDKLMLEVGILINKYIIKGGPNGPPWGRGSKIVKNGEKWRKIEVTKKPKFDQKGTV